MPTDPNTYLLAGDAIGARYAIELRDESGRSWWTRASADRRRSIISQVVPRVGKLYQKLGDARREAGLWREITRTAYLNDGHTWTVVVRHVNLTAGDINAG